MKKLLLLTKTLLVVALLCVGQNAWGDAVTTHSWTFTGLGSDTGVTTDGSTSLTESKTTCIWVQLPVAVQDFISKEVGECIAVLVLILGYEMWTVEIA